MPREISRAPYRRMLDVVVGGGGGGTNTYYTKGAMFLIRGGLGMRTEINEEYHRHDVL